MSSLHLISTPRRVSILLVFDSRHWSVLLLGPICYFDVKRHSSGNYRNSLSGSAPERLQGVILRLNRANRNATRVSLAALPRVRIPGSAHRVIGLAFLQQFPSQSSGCIVPTQPFPAVTRVWH